MWYISSSGFWLKQTRSALTVQDSNPVWSTARPLSHPLKVRLSSFLSAWKKPRTTVHNILPNCGRQENFTKYLQIILNNYSVFFVWKKRKGIFGFEGKKFGEVSSKICLLMKLFSQNKFIHKCQKKPKQSCDKVLLKGEIRDFVHSLPLGESSSTLTHLQLNLIPTTLHSSHSIASISGHHRGR